MHALVRDSLTSSNRLLAFFKSKIVNDGVINICALGGGPGSELLGIVSFIESIIEPDQSIHIEFLLIDFVKEWDETWYILKQSIETKFEHNHGPDRRKWPITISRSFLPLNTISVDDFSEFVVRFSDLDLLIFSYMVSEVKGRMSDFESVLTLLANRMSKTSEILFIDRNEKAVRESLIRVIDSNEKIETKSLKEDRGTYDFAMELFGDWYKRIKPIPRRKWQAFFLEAAINY